MARKYNSVTIRNIFEYADKTSLGLLSIILAAINPRNGANMLAATAKTPINCPSFPLGTKSAGKLTFTVVMIITPNPPIKARARILKSPQKILCESKNTKTPRVMEPNIADLTFPILTSKNPTGAAKIAPEIPKTKSIELELILVRKGGDSVPNCPTKLGR